MLRGYIFIFLLHAASLGINTKACTAALFLNSEALSQSVIFAQDERFQSVGMFRSLVDGQLVKAASGVLIAPDWVLTAAHVTEAWTVRGYTTSNVTFSVGNDGFNPIEIAATSVWINHPNFLGDTWGTDLALVRLASPITTVAPVNRFYGEDPAGFPWESPRLYTMAGFGQYGVLEGELSSDSLKRAGTNHLEGNRSGIFNDRLRAGLAWVLDDHPDTELEWKGTPGDSGGGWFYEVDGEWQLTAITCCGTLPHNGPGTSQATRVSLYNEWINGHLNAVPEPGTLFLLTSAIGWNMFRRNCRRQN